VKGIIRKRTIMPMTRTSSILPNFVAMNKIPTKMLKIIEEIMKIMSNNLPKFVDLFIILAPFK